MSTLVQDLKYGLRMLARNPGFTTVAVLSLALGIGANTAIFSIFDNLLLRPLPYEAPNRLVALSETKLDEPGSRLGVGQPDFEEWKERSQSFEEMARILWAHPQIVAGPKGAERVFGPSVTNGYFQILGGKTSRGRLFLPEEYGLDMHGELVVILSDGTWQRVFNSDPEIVGKGVKLNGKIHTVVGVMSPDFHTLWGNSVDYWFPIHWRSVNRQERFFSVIGRLKKGVDIQTAQAEMDVIARQIAKEDPDAAGFGVSVQPFQEWMFGYYLKRRLLPLFGAVLFVLLIACANVANLMLVRAAARDKEFAIRCAVGGGRGRLIRQLLTESTLLAVLGGVLGVLLAHWGLKLMVRLAPDAIPKAHEIALNFRVLGFTLLVALVTGVLFGLLPALVASKPNLNESLKETGRRATARFAGRRMHSVLVVADVALSLVLLVGAGLMIHSIWRVLHVGVGFNTENLITMSVDLPKWAYITFDETRSMLRPKANEVREKIPERLEALPGVKSASVATLAPLWGCRHRIVGVNGQPPPRGDEKDAPWTCFQPVGPDYFRTLQVPLLKGRGFTERDNGSSPPVALVNEAFVRRYFPSADPIGKVLRTNSWPLPEEDPRRQIVGVVGDVRQVVFREPAPAIYVPYTQLRFRFGGAEEMERTNIAFVIRTAIEPASLVPAMRRIALDVAREALVDFQTTDKIREQSVQGRGMKFYAWLLGIFAGIAVLLTAVGVFGVTSYSVTRRTHEIGIRMALGARSSDVVRMVLKQGLISSFLGVGIGLAAAFGLTRFLASLLYDVKPTDPVTFVAVSLMLIAVGLLACYIPARRAVKIDPMAALRYE
jgi:putative ABC transport system permease protein